MWDWAKKKAEKCVSRHDAGSGVCMRDVYPRLRLYAFVCIVRTDYIFAEIYRASVTQYLELLLGPADGIHDELVRACKAVLTHPRYQDEGEQDEEFVERTSSRALQVYDSGVLRTCLSPLYAPDAGTPPSGCRESQETEQVLQ
jgi:hypothetical protein